MLARQCMRVWVRSATNNASIPASLANVTTRPKYGHTHTLKKKKRRTTHTERTIRFFVGKEGEVSAHSLSNGEQHSVLYNSCCFLAGYIRFARSKKQIHEFIRARLDSPVCKRFFFWCAPRIVLDPVQQSWLSRKRASEKANFLFFGNSKFQKNERNHLHRIHSPTSTGKGIYQFSLSTHNFIA